MPISLHLLRTHTKTLQLMYFHEYIQCLIASSTQHSIKHLIYLKSKLHLPKILPITVAF